MEHFTDIIWLSLAMLVGCYIAGMLPLSITLSENKLHMVTVFGAGLLVGTALAVIIPEGVTALYDGDDIHEHHLEHHDKTTAMSEATLDTSFLTKFTSLPELETHVYIGGALCLGFVFMLMVDRCCGGHFDFHSTTDVENNARKNNGNLTATIGLVVHAAADGIAMGAAAISSKPEVEMIVFLAIMLHKAPAAFGLTTFLLQQGLTRNKIRKHLLVFSIAAPLLAILSYTLISWSGKENFSSTKGTGIAMLFSAGTFLYVATVHVLPVTVSISHNDNSCDGTHDQEKKSDLLPLVIGIILPLILTITNHHH